MDETWWRHQMETFSALLAICAGNSPVTGEFPAQRPVTRSFDVFFDLRLNKRLRKQSWGWCFETLSRPLWCHYNEIKPILNRNKPWQSLNSVDILGVYYVNISAYSCSVTVGGACLHIVSGVHYHRGTFVCKCVVWNEELYETYRYLIAMYILP